MERGQPAGDDQPPGVKPDVKLPLVPTKTGIGPQSFGRLDENFPAIAPCFRNSISPVLSWGHCWSFQYRITSKEGCGRSTTPLRNAVSVPSGYSVDARIIHHARSVTDLYSSCPDIAAAGRDVSNAQTRIVASSHRPNEFRNAYGTTFANPTDTGQSRGDGRVCPQRGVTVRATGAPLKLGKEAGPLHRAALTGKLGTLCSVL